jgi:hypothetical protein
MHTGETENLGGWVSEVWTLGRQLQNRGTSPIKKRPPPQEPPRTLRIGLRQGPRGMRFLVIEVTL